MPAALFFLICGSLRRSEALRRKSFTGGLSSMGPSKAAEATRPDLNASRMHVALVGPNLSLEYTPLAGAVREATWCSTRRDPDARRGDVYFCGSRPQGDDQSVVAVPGKGTRRVRGLVFRRSRLLRTIGPLPTGPERLRSDHPPLPTRARLLLHTTSSIVVSQGKFSSCPMGRQVDGWRSMIPLGCRPSGSGSIRSTWR